MPDFDHNEIMRRFPIGRIIELRQITKERIAFFARIMESTLLVQQHLQKVFKDAQQPPSTDDLNEVLDTLLKERPFDGMVSMLLGQGWSQPDASLHALAGADVMRKVVWAMIYADLAVNHQIDRQVWFRLKISLLENPPGGGVLIHGYDFKETDLGHIRGSTSNLDVCPDYPPASFLEDDHGNT